MPEMAQPQGKKPKLAKLPNNYKVEKRPLLRPAIASPYAGATSQKVVYVSVKTPFMSAVKRVQKLLSLVEKRDTQAVTAQVKNGTKRKRGNSNDIEQIAAAAAQKKLDDNLPGEAVSVKATGRAIEKALGLGLFFQQRDEYLVRITTGSVGAIDDIVALDDRESEAPGIAATDGDPDATVGEKQVQETGQENDVPESRIRHASNIEVAISLR